MLSTSVIRLTAIVLVVFLTGCANTPEAAPPDVSQSPAGTAPLRAAAEAPQETREPPEETVEYGSFTEEQLYRAIVAELGGHRGQMDQASEQYLDLAVATRDLSVVRRAVQFASASNDINALLQLGLLWAEIDPQDPQPHVMLSFEFLEAGNFDQALSHMARVVDLGANVDFTALASRTGQLDPRQRSRLIQSLRQLALEFPDEPSIPVTLVQLLAQNGAFAEALMELRALNDRGEPTPGLVRLEAQIQQSAGDAEAALRTLRDGVREFPDDRALRITYARLLVQDEQLDRARDQFAALVEQEPEDWETWYSVALLDLELEEFERAAGILERLVDAGQRTDEGHYYLGFAYEAMGELDEAIDQYRQVRMGSNNYLPAQQQATRLSIELGQLEDAHAWLVTQSRGQSRREILFTTMESGALIQSGYLDEARALLNRALNKYPNDVDLLFARVLLNDRLNDQQASERDLQQIIRMQPENAQALNHLGYMLADQTMRYEEALALIERAIAVEPDDPAIIDSLGWAQYKLGQYEEALRNLRRAYAAFPNDEVASHLGEVLWQLDRRDEAREIWEGALEAQPDSEYIREVMDRFLPDR